MRDHSESLGKQHTYLGFVRHEWDTGALEAGVSLQRGQLLSKSANRVNGDKKTYDIGIELRIHLQPPCLPAQLAKKLLRRAERVHPRGVELSREYHYREHRQLMSRRGREGEREGGREGDEPQHAHAPGIHPGSQRCSSRRAHAPLTKLNVSEPLGRAAGIRRTFEAFAAERHASL